MKTCSVCKETLPATVEFFYLNSKKTKYLSYRCRTCDNNHSRAYHKANADRLNKGHKEYNKINIEAIKAHKKVWDKANQEKNRGYARKFQAKKFNTEHTPYTEAEVLSTYGTNCYTCDLPIDLTVSRSRNDKGWKRGLSIRCVVPRSEGGNDDLQNVRPSHGMCSMEDVAAYIWG